METKSPCPPYTVTVRRNPPRRARPTPSSAVPTTLPRSPPPNISSFPIEDILSIEVPEKQLLTEHPSSSENLKVYLRVRPLISQRETAKIEKTAAEMKKTTKNAWPKNPKSTNALPKKLKKSNEVCVTVNDAHSVTLLPPQSLQDAKRIKSEVYEGFSHVFSSQASQREVYEEIVNPLVEDFLKGKSGMLAALGPSGSGKTHTIFGCGRDPGMVPLALRRILSQEEGEKKKSRRIFYLSMFEISSEKGKSEKIFDLSQDGADLCIQQSSIKGVREAVLYDAQQAESLIACGLLKRATAMTNSNSQSSRSQCIINIRCEYKRADGKVGDNSNSAVLTIVDLAGAEREKKTGNQGVRLLESNFINNTSMVFGLCLKSLLEHQKNPRKPMQKHFQNSLLTRYLRDYLEGKKRMALLLTVRPGEEDYLDTSFLLRQASPYTKIKFDIVEEHGILKHNKRPVQTTPSMGKLKRMKLSRIENCEINQRSYECQLPNEEAAVEGVKDDSLADVLVQPEEIITIEANERNILRVDHVELERKERNHQILQNFGKALWKVLKEYKRKLEVAENEICTLRDCLSSEKTRSAELENQLRDWQSNCCCRKGVSSEESSREEDEFRGKGSLDCEARQSTDQNEVDENETCTPRDCIIIEKTRWAELENELMDWQSNCCCRKGVSSEVSFREVDELRRKSSLDLEDHQSIGCNEVTSEAYSCPLEGSAHARNDERLDSTIAQQLESSIEDATGVEDLMKPNEMKAEITQLNGKATAVLSGSHSCTDQEYEQEEESSGNSVVRTSKATFINRDENDLLEEDRTFSDSVLPECSVSSSKSSLFVGNKSPFQMWEDQTQKEEDKVKSDAHTGTEERLDSTTAQKLERSIEDITGVEVPKIPDGMKAESINLKGKENALLCGSPSCTDQEYEQEEESFVCTSQATSVNRDENDLLEEDHTLFDSVLPECTVNSSESSLFIENNRSFPVVEDQTQNKEDKTAEQLESSIEDATGVEDLMKPNKMKAEITCLNGKATAVLSGSRSCTDQGDGQEMESSGSSKVLNPIGVEDLNPTGVENLMKPNKMEAEITRLNGKATAILSGSRSCTAQKDGEEMESSVCTSQATFINEDEASPFEEDHALFDSGLPECTVNSSESSVVVEYNNSFAVVENQTQSEEDKKPLGPSTMLMPEEVVHALGCHDNNTPEAVTKYGSCTKFQNADRPKRRLLPVSSILLKDIGNIDFKDENEKPKGVKAEKKGSSRKNRTQGSTSLFRLLKDNLAI
ncbi:PREDICTED: kinesin-like protein KIN-6 isoform X4 [Nicotiana attenuata]|uniref:kinesin-like protein KIN-6 isoform X4 n=1 Tax=Nicotiana attenuata TaxID=49451 RepID=UPI0009056D02|nr:PREDICTED: kinesin-like protein KIN-6 isoform X4 [Nicotiana attenuata]